MTDSFQVCPLEPVHFEGAADLMARAYNTEGFLERLTLQHTLEPQGCLGIWDSSVLVGTAFYIVYDSLAVVGLVATDPHLQRRGVARAGMEHLLNTLEHKEIRTVTLDASKAGQPLYQKLGFLKRGTSFVYKAGWTYAEPRATPTRVAQPEDLEWMSALDQEAVGGDRSRLLGAIFQEENVRVLTLKERGFAFVRGSTLGPVVAQTLEDARALFEATLSLEYRRAPVLCVPAQNLQVCNLLENLGFELQREFAYMEKGVARAGNREFNWALASFALG